MPSRTTSSPGTPAATTTTRACCPWPRSSTDQELALFYVWGHSYEFDVEDNWDNMEDLLTLVSGKEDVWYATNQQICRYLLAMRELKVQGGKLVNPCNTPLWVEVDGEVRVL